MTDRLDTILRDRFVPQLEALPGPDFADVRGRAGRNASGIDHQRRRRLPSRVVALVAAAVVLASGGASALAFEYLRGPSPGLTAGVSSFDRLPPAQWPSTMTRVGLENTAARVGLSATEAEARLRLLRSGLTQGELYAFQATDGTVCMFLTRHFGDCLHGFEAEASPGVAALISRRYPTELPAVVGVVADSVSAAVLVVGARHTEIEIINNSIYLDIVDLTAGDTVSLELAYADGSTRSVALHNPLSSAR